jgi:hypothetical protein
MYYLAPGEVARVTFSTGRAARPTSFPCVGTLGAAASRLGVARRQSREDDAERPGVRAHAERPGVRAHSERGHEENDASVPAL